MEGKETSETTEGPEQSAVGEPLPAEQARNAR